MRKCYLTSAYKGDREVLYLGEAEYGYATIFDPANDTHRVVPVDSIIFKYSEEWDDLL